MFETIFLPAMILGMSATSTPGPFQAYLLNTTLRYGWKRGIIVIFSPLIVDGPVILVTVFLLGQLPDSVLQIIRILGGLLLLWIAWGSFQQVRAGATFSAESDQEVSISPRRVIATAIAMNALSPGPYLFWATVNGPLLIQALAISPFAAIGMLLSFYVVFIGGMALLVLLFSRLGKIDARMTAIILWATIVLLVWFGIRLIGEGLAIPFHDGIALIAGGLMAVLAIAQLRTSRVIEQPI